jgi:broad specificity phosphatase PhoE
MRIPIEKTVYFIRHGESIANISPIFQSPDSPLSLDGVNQAWRVAIRIERVPFEVLVVSPLSRASQTAEQITRVTGRKPEYSDLFVERIKPTALEGKSYDDPEAERLYREWEKSLYTPGARTEDGENFDDLVLRSDRGFDSLVNRPEQIIVVVTHGFFLRTMMARLVLADAFTPQSFRNFQQAFFSTENASITVMKYGKFFAEKSWRLWTYNDHTHLN